MRILLTTDTVGGVWTFTQELTKQLLQRGHAVALVSFGRAPAPAQLQWVSTAESAHGPRFRFTPTDLPLEWMQNNDRAFDDGAPVLLSLAQTFGADLIHANQFCWGALQLGLPCIITAHSDVLSWAAACQPAGLPASPWLSHYTSLVQHGLDAADAVTAPTAWLQNALNTHFHVPCTSSVIPNGRTLPRTQPSTSRRLQAVTVGRLWDQAKGLQTLLETDSPIPIRLAGDDAFESSAAPSTSLTSLGLLAENDLLQLFADSGIYLATSIYEPFGLAPLEAALCGCAVVARDIPSLREVWADAALFFSNTAELSSILRELSASPTLLLAAQLKAAQRARLFTATRMTSAYLDLYESLIAKRTLPATPQQDWVTHAA